jgi:hypothetical protein
MPEKVSNRKTNAGWMPLIIAAFGLIVYLSFVVPYARALFFDYASLLENEFIGKYPGFSLGEIWLDLGRWLLLAGPFPLFLLVFTWFVHSLFKKWLGPWPLSDWSSKRKALLAASVLTPYLPFCFPFALAVSVQLWIEAFWWIRWYVNRDPVRDGILLYLTPVIVLGMWIAGIALVRAALKKPLAEKGRSFGRLVFRSIVLTLLLPFVVLGLGAGVHTARLAPEAWQGATFEETCGACHSFTRPLFFVKTPDEWSETVVSMASRSPSPVSESTRESVAGFLTGMRSFSDEWTFRTRCQRCHLVSHRSWDDRRPEDWARIVDRVARHNYHYYPPQVKKQVVGHLAREYGDPQATLGLEPGDYYGPASAVKLCDSCHPVGRLRNEARPRSEAETIELVRRMSRKMGPELPAEQISDTAASVKRLSEDDELFARLVPHDRTMVEGEER